MCAPHCHSVIHFHVVLSQYYIFTNETGLHEQATYPSIFGSSLEPFWHFAARIVDSRHPDKVDYRQFLLNRASLPEKLHIGKIFQVLTSDIILILLGYLNGAPIKRR
jgi:hypothetical protein